MDRNTAKNFASGLTAGTTAAVIWISICLMVGLPAKTTGLWALIFLVIGTAGTVIIATIISRSRAAIEQN